MSAQAKDLRKDALRDSRGMPVPFLMQDHRGRSGSKDNGFDASGVLVASTSRSLKL